MKAQQLGAYTALAEDLCIWIPALIGQLRNGSTQMPGASVRIPSPVQPS